MAIYECFDSFAAFERYLDDSGPDLEPAARMLIAEYCKYALDRAWFYYPDALPAEAISPEQRENNGHIDRKLSFPLEDLYPDGQRRGPGRAGNLWRRRGLRLRDARLPPCRGRAVPALLRPFRARDGADRRARADDHARRRRNLSSPGSAWCGSSGAS